MKIINVICCFLLIASIFSIGCNRRHNLNEGNVNKIKGDVKFANPKFEIIKWEIENDTLYIVSTEQSLLYPFQNTTDLDCFLNSELSTTHGLKYHKIKYEDLIIYHCAYHNSEISFVENAKEEKIQILHGKLYENLMPLGLDAKIGLDYKQYFKKVFSNWSNELPILKTIIIETGLTGTFYYLHINEQSCKIENIIIKSDFAMEGYKMPN